MDHSRDTNCLGYCRGGEDSGNCEPPINPGSCYEKDFSFTHALGYQIDISQSISFQNHCRWREVCKENIVGKYQDKISYLG